MTAKPPNTAPVSDTSHEQTVRIARDLYIKSAVTAGKPKRKGFWPFKRNA